MANPPPPPGSILWRDLTVPEDKVGAVKSFYEQVVGWTCQPHPVGGYDDYNVNVGDDTVAGICRARGSNANVPPQWLIYIKVESVARAVERAIALGGAVLDGPRQMGKSSFAVIRDPAGAVVAIIE